jgi:hypothetical protein
MSIGQLRTPCYDFDGSLTDLSTLDNLDICVEPIFEENCVSLVGLRDKNDKIISIPSCRLSYSTPANVTRQTVADGVSTSDYKQHSGHSLVNQCEIDGD